MLLALFISKRNRRSRESGWPVVALQSPDQLELTALSGIVVAPRPFQHGGEGRIPAVNGVGEPCAETARTVQGGRDWKTGRPAKDALGWHKQPETDGRECLGP